MTSPISVEARVGPSSPARALDTSYHYAVAAELMKALRTRNVSQVSLSTAIGVARRTVFFWTTGQSLPTIHNAARMAEALDWPELARVVRSARTVICQTCGRKVMSEHTSQRRKWCDEECRKVWLKGGHHGQVITRQDTKLALLVRSVDAMCWSCEPTGVCKDGGCPLRAVSPLALRRGLVEVAQAEDGRKSRWDDPAARERAAVMMRRHWEQAAGKRERVSEWNRRRWAAMTPEERAERGRLVSEALRRRNAAAA